MSAPPWQAQKTLDSSQAAAIIGAAFPDLKPLELQLLGAGWDNTVFLVNAKYVFRFPRRELALALLEQEWLALSALQGQLPLSIPVPCFRGQPSPAFDWPFSAYRLVPGSTACQAQLNPAQRLALVPQLAACLKTLHNLQPAPGLGPDSLRRLDMAYRQPELVERLQQVHTLGLIDSPEPYLGFLQQLPDQQSQQRPLVWVHGDLYVRHLVLDAQQALTGIIDWGDTHFGDPAVDLALVYAFLPPAAQAEFWQHYGQIDAETQLLARFRALFSCLAIVVYGADIGDRELVSEGLLGLRWLLP